MLYEEENPKSQETEEENKNSSSSSSEEEEGEDEVSESETEKEAGNTKALHIHRLSEAGQSPRLPERAWSTVPKRLNCFWQYAL